MAHGDTRKQYLADIEAKRWCMYVPKHERPVLSKLIKLGMEGGNVVSVNNGEEWVVKRSADKALVRSQLGHTGEDYLRFYDDQGQSLGTFSLIYGNGSENDPMIVISDYTFNPFCEAIWQTLNEKYGE